MKKIITISILFIMIVMMFSGMVNAATKDSLVNDLYALTSKYGVTEADKVKAERFLTENPITDEKANEIYEKAKEAIKVLEDAGVTDVKKLQTQLTREQKIKFEALCQETAALVGAALNTNISVSVASIAAVTPAVAKLLVVSAACETEPALKL